MSNARVLRVLVVDDSAYVRKVVTQLLSRSTRALDINSQLTF